jgi:hypothetical protein
MKIIKLFLLLSLGLWGEFKLDISNEIDTEQLQYIIENGWNDKNKTLNQLIIKYGEKVLSDAIVKMDMPLLVEVETSNIVDYIIPTTKPILNSSDYLFLVSYIKYLESIAKFEIVQKLYFRMLEGIDNVSDKSMLTLLYRQAFSEIILDGIEHSLKLNTFSEKGKEILKHQLIISTLGKEKTYFDAIEYDKNASLKQMKYTFEKQSEEIKNIHAKQLYINVLSRFEAYQDYYYGMLVKVIKSDKIEQNKFVAYIDKEYDEQSSRWNQMKYDFYLIIARIEYTLGIESKNTFIANYIAKFPALTLMPPASTYFSSYSNYIKDVKRRERLIEALNKT